MNRLVLVACVVLAAAAGFLVGRTAGPGSRSDNRTDFESGRTQRRVVELPAEEIDVLRQRSKRVSELEEANAKLRREVKRLQPALPEEEELPVGSRRPDGTIVGGARWSPMTRNMALGFLDTMMADFFKQANLTDDQKQRLMAEMELRISEGMQAAAEFVNGDATGDQTYDQLKNMLAESRKTMRTVLDDKQLAIYRKFESGMVGFVHGNVVNSEMASLRNRLGLDAEQAKQVRAIVEKRYDLVQKKLQAPIPNMFFRPVRREADGSIYEESGKEIRQFLTPTQVAEFNSYEANANAQLYEYRSLLVPKSK